MAELRTLQGHLLLLPDGSVSLGTDSCNQVQVAAHLGVAPVHFRLQPWEGGHFLEDGGSGLGTLVNGHPVNWKPLVQGDVITAGDLQMIYSQQTNATSNPAPLLLAPAAPVPLPPPPIPVWETPPDPAPPPMPGIFAPHSVTGHPLEPSIAGQAPVAVPPPAWLPEDLLPEAYRTPAQPAEASKRGAGTPQPDPPSSPNGAVTPRPPAPALLSGRRLLPLAALFALIGWSGYEIGQTGHFERFLPAMRSIMPKPPSGQPPASPASLPPQAAPAPPKAALRTPGAAHVPLPSSEPQIVSRIQR